MNWNPKASFWTETDFYEWQAFIRKTLVRDPKGWLGLAHKSGPLGGGKFNELTTALQLACDPAEKRPMLRFVPDSPLQAILGTVLADVIMAGRFRVCARQDCGRVFKLEWRREKYCSPRCAHTQSMRDSRRKAKLKKRRKQ